MRAQQRYCFAAVHLPVQPSDCLNVPPPLRPDRRPTVMTVRPLPLEVPYTRAVGTDGASGGLTDNLAAGDDDRVAAGARTCDAHGAHNPRAIETVAAAATALPRCAARFFRLGFVATCGSLGRARRFARTGKRFLVIADAAAGAAGLRLRNAASRCDRDEKREQRNPSGMSNDISHKRVLPIPE